MIAPSAVERRRLKYVATINDEALAEDTDPDYELQYVDIGTVDSSGIVHEIATYRFSDAPSRARRQVRDGDVIISTVRTYLQAIAPIKEPPKNLIVSTGFAVVRPRPIVFDPGFCKYALRESAFLAEVEMRSVGVSYPAINASDLGNIRIHLPALQHQRAVAAYLDRETARLDGLVATKEHMLELLAEKRRALITRAVTRGLDPSAPLRETRFVWPSHVPQGWEVPRLKRLAVSVESGVSVNATDQPAAAGEPGVLKTSAVSGGLFFPHQNKAVWPSETDRVACPVRCNTVIMSRMNTPSLVAESGYVDKNHPDLFLPDRLWQIMFDSKRVFTPFIAKVLPCTEARAALSEMATGTSGSMKNLAKEDMLSLTVPLPPITEQRAISDYIATENAKLDALSFATERTITLLRERRAALIAAAVTGQIEVEGAA